MARKKEHVIKEQQTIILNLKNRNESLESKLSSLIEKFNDLSTKNKEMKKKQRKVVQLTNQQVTNLENKVKELDLYISSDIQNSHVPFLSSGFDSVKPKNTIYTHSEVNVPPKKVTKKFSRKNHDKLKIENGFLVKSNNDLHQMNSQLEKRIEELTYSLQQSFNQSNSNSNFSGKNTRDTHLNGTDSFREEVNNLKCLLDSLNQKLSRKHNLIEDLKIKMSSLEKDNEQLITKESENRTHIE